jgi:hypothetical protein
MKTPGLLFLAISCAMLGRGTGDAVPSSSAYRQTLPPSFANAASGHPDDAAHAASPRDGKHPTKGTDSREQRDHGRASGPNHTPSRARLTKGNPPKQLLNSRQRSLPGNAMNLRQPGSDKSGGAARGGFIPNETIHSALPVRTSSVVRPTPLSLNDVHHRSPNPAVVGGSSNLRSSNAGAINGTRMNRKP